MRNTEESIIKGLSEGKETAYKYLYDTHYKALSIFAYQYVNDTFVAETIVGDIIFHLWQNRREIIILQSLRNYLLTAVKNRCLNYLEQQKRIENLTEHMAEQMETKQKNYEDQPEYPLSTLLEKELDVKINNALNALPQLTRKIFMLSRFSDLKYQQIAHETGVSVDVVKYHIKSALSHLRTELKDYLITILVFFMLFR